MLGNLLGVDLPDGTAIDYVGGRYRAPRRPDGVLEQGWLYQAALDPIAELDGTGAVVSRFVCGTRSYVADYMVRGRDTLRVVSDERGSVRLVVDAATGAVVQELVYDAWGRVLLDTNPGFQPFGYAGGLYDPVTGLVRFGARDYDAEVGRWTVKDPGGLAGGLNVYLYVEGDPVRQVDPDGLCPRQRLRDPSLRRYGTTSGIRIEHCSLTLPSRVGGTSRRWRSGSRMLSRTGSLEDWASGTTMLAAMPMEGRRCQRGDMR